MPGTILVSVLEFLGLPFSSSPSTISIKVSMGKREYQTSEKGEFSFPLTTLRETLVIVVQDQQGNEISYAVETKSIVEKGLWDDIFPLEGGGQVHMKLQFVLSEDEKNRIRVLRESAMKKNQRGLPDRKTNSLERITNDGSKISLSLNHHNADRNEESPSSAISSLQSADFNVSQVNRWGSLEKVEAQPFSVDISTKAVYSKESSSSIRRSESEFSLKSLSSVTPTKAVYSKESSSSIRRSESEFSLKSLSTDPPTKAVYSKELSSSLIRRSESEFSLKSLSDDTPTTAGYSKESSSSIKSLESRSFLKPLSTDPATKAAHSKESLSVDTPIKAVYSKESSSSLRSSGSGSSLKSLSDDTPTKAVFSKESSSSLRSLRSWSSSKLLFDGTPTKAVVPIESSSSLRSSGPRSSLKSLSHDSPTKHAFSKETSSSIRSSESGSSSKKRPSMERTPSSVKRMISAFESNLSQDIRPQIKPTPEKVKVQKVRQEPEIQVQLEELTITKLRGKGIEMRPNSKLKLEHKEPDNDKLREDLMRKRMTGMSLVAEKRHDQNTQQSSYNISSVKQDSCGSSIIRESQPDLLKSPRNSTARRKSTHKVTKVAHQEDLSECVEIPAAWIFPDHHRRFCVTTGGKKVMDFLEGRSVTNSFSIPEKDSDDCDSQSETKRSKKTLGAEKSQPESEDVGSSTGLFEQVTKVAIMVGFGLLVLLTRQRNNR